MKKFLALPFAALALAVPAVAAARVPPAPIPGGPIVVQLDPACVAYATTHHLPILSCIGV